MIRRRYTAALWIGGNLVFGARDLGVLSASVSTSPPPTSAS